MEKSFEPVKYNKVYGLLLVDFLEQCLPESGRILDINGRHSSYKDIENSFKSFWCMFDQEKMIGVVAVKELDEKNCELKSLYLLQRYHGMGYGKIQSERPCRCIYGVIFKSINSICVL